MPRNDAILARIGTVNLRAGRVNAREVFGGVGGFSYSK
jgi:hypothetical protein